MIRDFLSYIGRVPDRAEPYAMLGLGYLKSGRYVKAIAAFSRAIELDPRSAGAYAGRAEAHRLVGNTDEAMQDCAAAIGLRGDPRYVADAYRTRAKLLWGADRGWDAYQDIREAYWRDPRTPKFLDRTDAYLNTKNFGPAGLIGIVVLAFALIFRFRLKPPQKKYNPPEEENTRGKLLRAAIRVFAEKGFEGATVRDICSEAGANVAAVNYYFGSKERLYESVIKESIYQRAQEMRRERLATQPERMTPEERLRDYILRLSRWVFGVRGCGSGSEDYSDILVDLRKICNRETASPTTPEISEMIHQLIKDDTDEFRGILRDILGRDAPEDVVRDCDCSIVGQIFYYDSYWEMHISLNPDRPSMQEYLDQLVNHIFRFSLAGLKETKNALDEGRIEYSLPDWAKPLNPSDPN
jgi:AcrR family transcriptional regulator